MQASCSKTLAAMAALVLIGVGCGDDPTGPISSPFVSITAGVVHTCGVGQNGEAYCWGWNRDGQLGDGTKDDRAAPVRVQSGGVAFEALSGGGAHTCGLGTDGFIYCWGFNLNGQLGDGTMDSRTAVARIDGGIAFDEISVGASYSCGLSSAQGAFCWGWNERGQLGDGSTVDRPTPVTTADGIPLVSISASSFHSCGVTAAGDAYCWGQNESGQLGDGTTTDSPTPVQVAGGQLFQSVSTGFRHTCGISVDGEAFCWGYGELGQLGNGTSASWSQPVAVTGSMTFTQLSAGTGNFTCGITPGGDAFCWGFNNNGQLGELSSDDCTDPEQGNIQACALDPLAVSGGLTFRQITAGTQHSCGLSTDNVAYCWGLGNLGQLGTGEKGDLLIVVEPARVAGQP